MCNVTGCHYPATKFSNLCERHRNTARIHGHPLQRGVTKTELKPYERAVQRYLATKSGAQANSILERNWRAIVEEAQQRGDAFRRGQPRSQHEQDAVDMILAVSRDRPAVEIATTMMAMGYFYQFNRNRWASEEGFRFQVVRMFRKMVPGQTSYGWEPDGSMKRSSMRRCPVRAVGWIWRHIEDTRFIHFGIQIAVEDEKARQRSRRNTIGDLREILGPSSSLARGEAV